LPVSGPRHRAGINPASSPTHHLRKALSIVPPRRSGPSGRMAARRRCAETIALKARRSLRNANFPE
ncbi:MAG: hypothetical protein ACREFV_11380, partial [Acetobacteraceae bacterium]